MPFSDGPGRCPGRNVVLLVTSSLLAALLQQQKLTLQGNTVLSPDRPLPATLNNFGLTFRTEPTKSRTGDRER